MPASRHPCLISLCRNCVSVLVLNTQVVLTASGMVVRQTLIGLSNPLIICFIGQVQGFQRELDIVIQLVTKRRIDVGGAASALHVISVAPDGVGEITAPAGDRSTTTECITFVVQGRTGGIFGQSVERTCCLYLACCVQVIHL